MPSQRMPKLFSPGPGVHDLSLVVIVESDRDLDPRYWERHAEAEPALKIQLVILDRRMEACPTLNEHLVVRRPGIYPGPDLEEVLDRCSGKYIAFIHGAGQRSPGHLSPAIRVLDLHPDIQAIVTDCDLVVPQTGELHRVHLRPLPASPPPGWLQGTVFRRTSLNDLSPLAFFPVLLHRYRALRRVGEIRHLPVPGYQVEESEFKQALVASRSQGDWLDRWSDSDVSVVPEISVILVCRGSLLSLRPALRSLCNQSIPPQAIQLVLVAEGTEGTLEGVDPERFPVRVDLIRRRVHGIAKALNKALTQCVAPITALCATGAWADPGWAQQHLRLHQQRTMEQIAVTGPLLEPNDGSPLSRVLDEREIQSLSQGLGGLCLANSSVPTRQFQALGGWAPANSNRTMEMELRLRLARHGIRTLGHPEAIVRRCSPTDLKDLENMARSNGRAQVELCGTQPDAVDALELADLGLPELRSQFDASAAQLPRWVETALRIIDESAGNPIPKGFGQGASFAHHKELTTTVASLVNAWTLIGQVTGLRAHGAQGFDEFLASAPLHLPEDCQAPWVLLPDSKGEEGWIAILQGLLRSPDGRPLVLWAHPDGGYGPEELAGIASVLRHRASIEMGRASSKVFILEPHPPRGRMVRFLYSCWGWIPSGAESQETISKLAEVAQAPRRSLPEAMAKAHPLPWPVSSQAVLRILAWPRWDIESEMDRVLSRYGALLIGRQDCCLCLRLDPDLDPPIESALAFLEASYQRSLGESASLEVLIIHEALDDNAWRRLGAAVSGFLWLESSNEPTRTSRLELSRSPDLRSPMALQHLLERLEAVPKADTQAHLLFLNPSPRP